MQAARIDSARRMTPENRLLACINLAQFANEIQRAGRRDRESKSILRQEPPIPTE